MAEITIRIGGRNVSVELSEAEARKILDDLLFRSNGPKGGSLAESIISRDTLEDKSTVQDESISGSDFRPIPSRDEVMAFIKSQPEYKHSVESIAEHFAQCEVSSTAGRAENLWLNSIRGYGNRIREEIAQKENGTWKEDRRGRKKAFRFVRQDENMTQQGSLFGQLRDNDQQERE